MGILDDAIKEHLELKRQHGADDSELKQLEDEAFGAAERPGEGGTAPDPLAEAPTEFMEQPPAAAAEDQEGPGRPSPRAEIADLQEAPPSKPDESAPEPEAPAEEESPAMEHEAVPEPAPPPEPEPTPEPEISSGPTTEEREAIAEQPTEMYDIEEELASSQAEAPSEEELVEEEIDEPRLAPVDPLAGLDDDVAEVSIEEDEEDDDFWDEQAPLRRARPGAGGAERGRGGRRGGGRLRARARVRAGGRGRAGGGRGPSPPAPTRTCSRRPPTSSRRPPRTTSSGSSRSPPRTSTSTTELPAGSARPPTISGEGP